MSFLTAASDRSSSGSGVSGVSAPSFSGVSSLTAASLVFEAFGVATLVLLAINSSPHVPTALGTTASPYSQENELQPPTLWGLHTPPAPPSPGTGQPRPPHPSRSGESRRPPVSPEPTKLRLTLSAAGTQALSGPRVFATNRAGRRAPPRPIFHHLQGLCGTARRSAEPLDQGLGAVEDRQPGLHVLQPGIVGLGRLTSQRLLGVLKLPK